MRASIFFAFACVFVIALMSSAHADELQCGTNQHVDHCPTQCPTTCENHDSLHACNSLCGESKCVCDKGFVLNTSNNECVLPTECP